MANDSRLGTEVAGYRIESQIGRGGMSTVYLARDLRLERNVALKLLAPQLAESERFRERFLRESRLAASLDHPNIVPVYDAGEVEGVLYIAMRYVEGTDLHRLIGAEGPLDPDRTLSIMAQVAGALDFAHDHDLVHRDVKPSNVLLVPRSGSAGSDHVYLSDFGLTKRALSVSGLTETGQLVGTIDYVAPEQIKGDPVDGRADIYSLGCLLYECFTGKVPYARDLEVAVLWAHVQEPPPQVTTDRPDLPEEVDRVVAHAMAKSPEERTPSGEVLVGELRTALGYEPGVARPRPKRKKPRRGRLAVALAAAVVLAAAAAGAFLLLGRGGAAVVPPVDSVGRIDAGSHAFAQSIGVGTDPIDCAVDERGDLWVINQGNRTVTRIDPATGQTLPGNSTLGVPTGIAAGEGAVWIVNGFGGEGDAAPVVRVNPSDNRVEQAFDTPNGQAIAVAFGAIWVADSAGDRVLRYDPVGYDLVHEFPMKPNGASPEFLAVGTGKASGIWVVNSLGNSVVRIDPKTSGMTTFGIEAPTAVAAVGGAVWVTSNANDSVTRIDPVSGIPVATLTLADNGIPDGPSEIVVGADGVWVGSSNRPVVARIDPTTNRVVETLEVAGVAGAMAVDLHGDVWVAVHRR